MSISVVIPVGPYPANSKWLDEAIDSVKKQTYTPDELLLIDDGAGLPEPVNDWTRLVKMPWRTGISHAFNYGVAIAYHELVFLLGSDDTLEPTCLARCIEAWDKLNGKDAYYSVAVKYMDTGECQSAPCNAAMVTKGFWRLSGGFPIESSVGCGDSMLLSICLGHHLPVYQVGYVLGEDPEVPLYNVRRHPDMWGAGLANRQGIIHDVRDAVTRDWTKEGVQSWIGKY